MKTIKIHCLQHVPFEGPGYIKNWAEENTHKITYTRFYEKPHFPLMNDFDLLLVMGGPMSVNDESEIAWLKVEKEFIQQAISNNKYVMGICLGAQLIANTLGASVYKNPVKEIGWFPINTVESARSNPILNSIPEKLIAFHWHGETFDLPEHATLLFSSDVCKNQAFVVGEKILGLQFHLEATVETVHLMVEHCNHELVPIPTVQDASEILSEIPNSASLNAALSTIMENFLKLK